MPLAGPAQCMPEDTVVDIDSERAPLIEKSYETEDVGQHPQLNVESKLGYAANSVLR